MKAWRDYSQTISSIAQSFVAVCQQSMTKEQLQAWANDQLTPNDCMDANLILDGIIENHGIHLWVDGFMDDDAINFFNQCYSSADSLNQRLQRFSQTT